MHLQMPEAYQKAQFEAYQKAQLHCPGISRNVDD